MILTKVKAFVLADVTKEYKSKKDNEMKLWREVSIVGENDITPIIIAVPPKLEDFRIDTKCEYVFKLSAEMKWGKIVFVILEKEKIDVENELQE